MFSVQRLSDTSGDWLAGDKAEDYNGLSVAAGWAPASLRTLASESVAGQAGHLACLPESPLSPLLPTPALPGDGLVFPPSPTETTPALSFVGVVYTSATIASMQRKG